MDTADSLGDRGSKLLGSHKAQWKRQLGDLEAESASRTLASLKKKRKEAGGEGSAGWKEKERKEGKEKEC